MIAKEKILAYALENAIMHDGKARADAILNKLFKEGLKKEEIKEILPVVKDAVNSVNALPLEEQKKQFLPLASFIKKKTEKIEQQEIQLPPLPKAEKGKVVLRFAPFPSGPLHIGNARTVLLNDFYRKMYDGKFFLVMDDTIGSEEKILDKDAYKLIEEGLSWLGVEHEKTIYRSDRLEIYYDYAKKLIEKNAAYVCFCSAKKLRKFRAEGKECECRKRNISENLKEWQAMLEGKYKEGQATLRIKTDMRHPNPAFRDRVLFRISRRAHPRKGKKYKVWPMLEICAAVDDALLGITHIIRGSELMIESDMEKLLWQILDLPQSIILHHGLLRLEGIKTKISKSIARKKIAEKKWLGWSDPRTWSLQSLARRGIEAEAVKKFCLGFGMTAGNIAAPIDILYSENRKLIDKKANRYFFVSDPVKIKIKSPVLHASLPLHPDFPERGMRSITTKGIFYITKQDYEKIKKEKGNWRLIHLLNFDSKLNFLSVPVDEKLKARLIHWLPADKEENKKLVKVEILMPEGNIIRGLGEENIKNLKIGEVIQFERFGFVKLDNKEKNKFVFLFAHK